MMFIEQEVHCLFHVKKKVHWPFAYSREMLLGSDEEFKQKEYGFTKVMKATLKSVYDNRTWVRMMALSLRDAKPNCFLATEGSSLPGDIRHRSWTEKGKKKSCKVPRPRLAQLYGKCKHAVDNNNSAQMSSCHMGAAIGTKFSEFRDFSFLLQVIETNSYYMMLLEKKTNVEFAVRYDRVKCHRSFRFQLARELLTNDYENRRFKRPRSNCDVNADIATAQTNSEPRVVSFHQAVGRHMQKYCPYHSLEEKKTRRFRSASTCSCVLDRPESQWFGICPGCMFKHFEEHRTVQ